MGAAVRNTGIEIPVDEGREVWESQVARRDIPGVPCAGQRAPSGAFIVSGLRFSVMSAQIIYARILPSVADSALGVNSCPATARRDSPKQRGKLPQRYPDRRRGDVSHVLLGFIA
jgi:hypothetical protein